MGLDEVGAEYGVPKITRAVFAPSSTRNCCLPLRGAVPEVRSEELVWKPKSVSRLRTSYGRFLDPCDPWRSRHAEKSDRCSKMFCGCSRHVTRSLRAFFLCGQRIMLHLTWKDPPFCPVPLKLRVQWAATRIVDSRNLCTAAHPIVRRCSGTRRRLVRMVSHAAAEPTLETADPLGW